MAHSRFMIILLLTLFSGWLICDVAQAQKGRGKGPHKQNGANHAHGGRRSDPKPHSSELTREKSARASANPKGWAGQPNVQPPQFESDVADKQMLVEQRKLEHRMQIADHLRQISERNGNQNLQDVADRLERKAQQHYEQRMAKINVGDGSVEPIPVAPEPTDQSPLNAAPNEIPSPVAESVEQSVLEKPPGE